MAGLEGVHCNQDTLTDPKGGWIRGSSLYSKVCRNPRFVGICMYVCDHLACSESLIMTFKLYFSLPPGTQDLNKLKAFGGVEGVRVSLSVSRWQAQISDSSGMVFRAFVYNVSIGRGTRGGA